LASNPECDCTAASVYETARAYNDSIGIYYGVDRLASRSARSHNVLDDKNSLAATEAESPTERHRIGFAFGKKRTHANCPGSFVRENDPADRRSYNDVNSVVFESRRHQPADQIGVFWVLEHQRALQISRAVQTGGQQKMPIQ
jgi:hypothetical protein